MLERPTTDRNVGQEVNNEARPYLSLIALNGTKSSLPPAPAPFSFFCAQMFFLGADW